MPRFKIKIEDSFFNKVFTSESDAPSESEAIRETLDFYAYELDTVPNELNIISIENITAPVNYLGGRAIIDATGRALLLDQQKPPEPETDEQRDAFYNL